MSQQQEKPVIYLPSLPSLSSDNLTLYQTNHDARIDLVLQLAAAGMYVEDIDGANSWVKTMLTHAEHSDAFVFPPMTSLPESHPSFKAEAAQRWFEFFSLVTGVHIGNLEKYGRDGYAKPCIVMDPDGQWSLAMNLLADLRAKGMFNSGVEEIMQIAPPPAERGDYHSMNKNAVETLLHVMQEGKRKSRKEIITRYPADYNFEPFRIEMNRHPFGFAVFGSASTKEGSYKNMVAKTAKMGALRGWRMVSGAGYDGCMGAADKGYEEGKREFNQIYPDAPFKPAHVGVSTLAILRLEGPPEHLDQLIITDDIYDRMKIMISGQRSSDPMQRTRDATKILFIAPGGTGTLHELATLLQLATNGSMMADRKVIVLNFPSHLDTSQGFWDPLIATAKKLGFDRLFEVAHSPEEAIAISDRFYKEWLDRHKEYIGLPHPLFT